MSINKSPMWLWSLSPFLNGVYRNSLSLGLGLLLMAVCLVAQADVRLINISTRAPIEGGAGDIIAGFIIEGTGTQRVVIRGWNLEVGVDPKLILQKYPSGDFVASNDNWKTDLRYQEIPESMTTDFDEIDAALLLDLPVGAYTVTLSSVGEKGLGLVGVDAIDGTSIPSTKLINISTRAPIHGGAGDIIAGFIIQGTGTQRVVIRGWNLEAGVDPKLVLQKYPSGDFVASNDNWKTDSRYQEIPESMTTDFDEIDAALLLDLPVGAYTVTLSSVRDKGIGLVGVDAIAVTTTTPTPPITTSPPANSTLDFGGSSVAVGSSMTQQITINNDSDTPLTVESVSITGPDANDFEVLTQLPLTISPTLRSNQKIIVQCTPSKGGILKAALKFVTSSIGLSYNVECVSVRIVQSCSSSDEDCRLAKKFAPVLHISEEPDWGGGSDVGPYSHYPYADYIPINVNDLTTSSEGIFPQYHTENDIFYLHGMDIENLRDTLKYGGVNHYMSNHYIDYSQLWKGISKTVEASYGTLDLHPTVYFRVFRNSTQKYPIAIQYWFFYFYNDWMTIIPIGEKPGLTNTNHAADWESITLFLDENEIPMEAVYSTHYEANRHSWEKLEKRNTQPLVFISHGGHGSYIRSGETSYLGWDDEHQGGGGILTHGEISSVTEGSYVLENLKDKSWIKFDGIWGSEKSGLQGPLYRTDASTITDWSLAKNKPRDPYTFCNARKGTLLYGIKNNEKEATNEEGVLSSLYGPWCWASGYVLDGNHKECRPIIPIIAEINCKGGNPIDIHMDLNLSINDSFLNLSSKILEAKDYEAKDYDETPIYFNLYGRYLNGITDKIKFIFDQVKLDSLSDIDREKLDSLGDIWSEILNKDFSMTLIGCYDKNCNEPIRQDSFEGKFNATATDVVRKIGEGCNLDIKLTVRKDSPCEKDYYPPNEIPAFQSPGYISLPQRFTNNHNGTVTDNETGLIWLQNANCVIAGSPDSLDGKKNLLDAFILASTLRAERGSKVGRCDLTGKNTNLLGDWRLAEITELRDMLSFVRNNYQQIVTKEGIFNQVEMWKYWSATKSGSENAALFNMEDGQESYESKNTSYHVWPVHSRFTDNGNGTVTDNHTGLIWLKNTTCLGQKTWQEADLQVQGLAQGQCHLSDNSVAGDWRLPSDSELGQLMRWRPTVNDAFGQPSASYWSNTPNAKIPNAVNIMQLTADVVTFVEADKNAEKHDSWAVRSRRTTECVGTAYLNFYPSELSAPCDDKSTDWEQSVFKQWDEFR